MKFKHEPNHYVRLNNKFVQRSTGLKGFHFDDKGEFETDNEVLIGVLSQHFEKSDELHACKKCDFTTDNKGLLMAHYREHKKEEVA